MGRPPELIKSVFLMPVPQSRQLEPRLLYGPKLGCARTAPTFSFARALENMYWGFKGLPRINFKLESVEKHIALKIKLLGNVGHVQDVPQILGLHALLNLINRKTDCLMRCLALLYPVQELQDLPYNERRVVSLDEMAAPGGSDRPFAAIGLGELRESHIVLMPHRI